MRLLKAATTIDINDIYINKLGLSMFFCFFLSLYIIYIDMFVCIKCDLYIHFHVLVIVVFS